VLSADSGAERPLANAGISAIVAAYRPTQSAACSGKCLFTKGTFSTFAVAMPIAISNGPV